jgi:hypothetical protein
MTYTASELRQRVQRVNMLGATLQGVKAANTARRDSLTVSVADAKGRLGLGDEIKRVFEALQTRAHERSVGTFDRLLTAILEDVLPGVGKVRLLPKFRDNTTWLDIKLEQENGKLRDILEGNGGAVTNVVSTGLRFASLMRTKNRALMILDEPDCWVKYSRIPAFVNVIAQVATQANVQTFFISHYERPEEFAGQVNLVRLFKGASGNPEIEVLQPVCHEWENDEVPGIRTIELHNFRAHVKTIIPCFPGATAFLGDNNLGKSAALTSALKAFAYGESDEDSIHDDADEARIVLHLEKGIRVEWIRNRKKSPAVMYRLYQGDSDTPIQEGRPKTRNTVPDFIAQVLGIERVDDLDIQIGNQKDPVFLLNEAASKRAQLLSLGRESGHLVGLMKRYEGHRATDSETVKRGELELTRLEFDLKRMEPLERVTERLRALGDDAEKLIESLTKREQLKSMLNKLEESRARLAQYEKEIAVLQKLPELPKLVDVATPKRLHDAIVKSAALLKVIRVPEIKPLPVLVDTTTILSLGVRLSDSKKRLNALSKIPAVPRIVPLQDLTALKRTIESLEGATKRLKTANEEVTTTAAAAKQAEAEYEKTKEELGYVCPLCDSHMAHGHEHKEGLKHAA